MSEIDRLRAALAEVERERDELRIKHIRGNYADLGNRMEMEAWQQLWDRAERAEAALAAALERQK